MLPLVSRHHVPCRPRAGLSLWGDGYFVWFPLQETLVSRSHGFSGDSCVFIHLCRGSIHRHGRNSLLLDPLSLFPEEVEEIIVPPKTLVSPGGDWMLMRQGFFIAAWSWMVFLFLQAWSQGQLWPTPWIGICSLVCLWHSQSLYRVLQPVSI